MRRVKEALLPKQGISSMREKKIGKIQRRGREELNQTKRGVLWETFWVSSTRRKIKIPPKKLNGQILAH